MFHCHFTSTRSLLVMNPFPSLSKTLKASLTCTITSYCSLSLFILSINLYPSSSICILHASLCANFCPNTEEDCLDESKFQELYLTSSSISESLNSLKGRLLISFFCSHNPLLLFNTYLVISQTNSLKLMSPLPS